MKHPKIKICPYCSAKVKDMTGKYRQWFCFKWECPKCGAGGATSKEFKIDSSMKIKTVTTPKRGRKEIV